MPHESDVGTPPGLLSLRETIAQWPSPVCVLVGSGHRIAAASEPYVRLVGGRVLLERPFAEALPELHRQGYTERLDRVYRTGRAETGAGAAVRWDRVGNGDEQAGVVDFAYQPLRDGAGRVCGVLVEVRDVTEQVRAQAAREEALAHAEALAVQLQEQAAELEQQTEEAQALAEELEQTVEELHAASARAERERARAEGVLDATADAYVFLDHEWRIAHLNPAGARLLGKRADEVVGRTHWEEWPASPGSEVERQYRRAVAEGVPAHFVHHYVDGSYDVHLEIDAYPAPGGLAIFFRDVTALVHGEEERQRLVAMLENSPDFVGIATLQGRPLYLNPAGRELVGLSAEEARHTPLDDYFPPADLEYLHGVILPTQAREGRWVGEFRLRHFRTGEIIPVHFNAFEIRHPGSSAPLGVATVTRDLRRQKEAEAERQRLLESAQAARADAEAATRAKSQFLATMSHEIRTPINAIIGYSELLELGIAGPLTGGQAEYLDRVKASSRHLLGLINDVLDLSKLDAGGMTAVAERASLASAAAEAMALVAPQAEARGLRLEEARGCDAEALYVGDPDRVRQILVNLLSNAVKFTEPGGRVSLRCRTSGKGEEAWAVLEVEDTGIGIAPEQLARVFDPFVQLDATHTRTRGGTGLGLAISRNLARLMGGELTAASVPGRGSTFALWLPAPDTRRRAAPSQDADAPDVLASWAFGPGEVPGLAAVGHILAANADAVAARFGERVATDPETPSAHPLDRAHRENHFATTTLEIGKALAALDEGGGEPALLGDVADIQRTVAERHGRQRLRHGWSAAELRRETQILWEEIQALVLRELPDHTGADPEAALDLVRRLLLRAERIALASHAAWAEAGVAP